MNRPVIFIINDYFGHGGHVKSFITHINSIKDSVDFKIICSKNGFCSKNINKYTFLNKEKLYFYNFKKMTKYQFDFNFFNLLKKISSNDSIIHTYSFEAIFMMSLIKIKYKNVSTITSVMGGLNPFPYLSIIDHYIAVSEEQKIDASRFSDLKVLPENSISIIKNRITIDDLQVDKNDNDKKAILIVTRFDNDKLDSLKRIFDLINEINEKEKIIIAGEGSYLDEYKSKYRNRNNIHFLGYEQNLISYVNKIKLVIGMGRSILEFMLQHIPAILIGYKGIEILNKKEKVEFASKYNFSGREIYENKTIYETKEYIYNPIEYDEKSIYQFLKKEYDMTYYKNKYTSVLDNISSKKISYISIIKCYLHVFKIRLKRKINK